MNLELVRDNLLSPPILFFALGVLAVLLKSDLEIPQPIPKLFSLYLLLAIGFKGGVELRASGLSAAAGLTLGAAVVLACVVPVYCFFILRWKLDVHNAAAIAATYGSISAVTFITASSYLAKQGHSFSGHLVAAMALMESPAIIIGVMLVRLTAPRDARLPEQGAWRELLHDAFLNGAVFLLLGSLIVGALSGKKGDEMMAPLTSNLFKGVLALFLLDIGLVAARQLRSLRKAGAFLIAFAIVMPMINAALAIAIARLIGLNQPDALMFAVLGASASYIAVPAAVRIAIPEANPSLFLPMALAITFPFNITVGIPMYDAVIRWVW